MLLTTWRDNDIIMCVNVRFARRAHQVCNFGGFLWTACPLKNMSCIGCQPLKHTNPAAEEVPRQLNLQCSSVQPGGGMCLFHSLSYEMNRLGATTDMHGHRLRTILCKEVERDRQRVLGYRTMERCILEEGFFYVERYLDFVRKEGLKNFGITTDGNFLYRSRTKGVANIFPCIRHIWPWVWIGWTVVGTVRTTTPITANQHSMTFHQRRMHISPKSGRGQQIKCRRHCFRSVFCNSRL